MMDGDECVSVCVWRETSEFSSFLLLLLSSASSSSFFLLSSFFCTYSVLSCLSLFFFLSLLCFSLGASAHYLSETRETQLIRQISWHNPTVNSRPLIGILSQPGDGDGGLIMRRKGWNQSSVSYIAASYVKFIEMGGARVIPLLYNEPEHVMRRVRFLISPSLPL